MKKILFIALVTVLLGTLVAQEKWEYSFDVKGTLSQSFYTDNWDGEEESNINWLIQGNMTANKQLLDWFRSMNTLKMKFGQIYDTEKDPVTDAQLPGWQEPRKSDDEIDLLSLGLITLDGWVDPYVSLRLETVFEGTNKRAFDPARFSQGIGASKIIFEEPRLGLNTRAGLLMRENYIYGVSPMIDGGAESVTEFMWVCPFDKTKFTSNLFLFQAFFNSEEDDLVDVNGEKIDDWKQLDIEWTNELSIQLYKYLSFNVYTQLLYDKEIDYTGRFKQTSGLSITYKLF
ncbi:hypothetical protein JEZ13_10280 [bacterium]|nr:hypothetical protein [bacterium]